MSFIYLFSRWLPLIWLLVAIGLGIIEIYTVDLVAIWFALGAMVAIIPAILMTPFWVQLLVCLVVGLVSLYFTRPIAKNILKVKVTKTNADSIIGMVGIVVEEIDNTEERGRVHVNGLDWSARSDDGAPMSKGDRVLIKAIQGVKVIVEHIC